MNETVTVNEMKAIEKRAAESGLSYYQMMENAGTAAYVYIKGVSKNIENVLVFCGKGNNGGDGFVVARKFKQDGALVNIVLVDGPPKTQDAQKNMSLCDDLDIPILDVTKIKGNALDLIKGVQIIVDAIYGTGFHGELNKSAKLLTEWINQSEAEVFALDIPSGLNGDIGKAADGAVHADHTIAFHRYKPVHFAQNAETYCGRLICADIGITDKHLQR